MCADFSVVVVILVVIQMAGEVVLSLLTVSCDGEREGKGSGYEFVCIALLSSSLSGLYGGDGSNSDNCTYPLSLSSIPR